MTIDIPARLESMAAELAAMIDQSINAHVCDGSDWEQFADAMIDAKAAIEMARKMMPESKDG